ncbi:MAG: hypothetical protein KVP17_004115 [Porospora cf. gigantea B]|uniref:uncharacterized protein n=1 Tax=Porospora cf. gigantea B TaxID=2853592 RepID=UPI003571FBFB|nr:MAG: hypothetical protein KVP17_004115 [Porospora cf. gigantea B]
MASDMAEGLENIEDTEAGLALFTSMEAEYSVLSERVDVATMTKALQDQTEQEKLLSGQLGMLAGLIWVCFLVKSLL